MAGLDTIDLKPKIVPSASAEAILAATSDSEMPKMAAIS